MADSESFGVATNVGKSSPNADAKENPNETPLGIFSPFPYSPEPFVDLSQDGRAALLTLDSIATRTDSAARRLEVEQAWEALHFERGYQHLLKG